MPRRKEDYEKNRVPYPFRCGEKWSRNLALKLASSALVWWSVSWKPHNKSLVTSLWGHWEKAEALGGGASWQEVRSLEACPWMVLGPPLLPVTLLGGQLCPIGALLHLRPEAAEPPGCGLGTPDAVSQKSLCFLTWLHLRYFVTVL